MSVYQQIVLATAVCAAVVCVGFLVLVVRRFLSEKNKNRRDARDTAITRNYLQRVAGHRVESPRAWTRSVRFAAISRILPLLRGGERRRLLQIAELDGVLVSTLRNSHGIYRNERINAIHLLQRYGSEACIARLRELMARDHSLKVRLEAAFALAANASLPPPRETLHFLKALGRRPNRMDVALLRSSAPLYPEQMMILLEDELDVVWRAQIIDALGWSEDFSVMEVLNQAAIDADPDVRSAALSAFARLGHPAAGPWVLASLRDPVVSVRLQAISTSVQLGLTSALPQLSQLLEDGELWIRLRAEQAIEEMTPPHDSVEISEAAR